MQAVARLGSLGRLYQANIPCFVAVFRNTLLFLGLFGLPFLYVASSRFGLGPYPNIIAPSILVILGSMMLVGTRALTITLYDYYFFGFILLSVVSHIYADEYLYRELSLGDLETNVQYILTMALFFRAFFCLIYVAPRYATRMFLYAWTAVLSFVSLLGVMQRFGPGKATAVHIGSSLTVYSVQVVEEANIYNRPSGVFSNPNILGYATCVLAAISVGWGLSNLKELKPWKTVAVMLLLGLSFLCVIASQSRQSFLVLLAAPVVFAIFVQLRARDPKNLVAVAIMFAIAGIGLTTALSTSKSDYLTSITKTGVRKDASVGARFGEVKALQPIVGEIAAGGSGQSMSNANSALMVIEHSRYNTSEIDSEWANMFQAFGVWGPLLLLFLYLFNAFDARQVWLGDEKEGRTIACVCFALLVFNLALTISAVRVSKFESAGLTFAMLGALAAWKVKVLERSSVRIATRSAHA